MTEKRQRQTVLAYSHERGWYSAPDPISDEAFEQGGDSSDIFHRAGWGVSDRIGHECDLLHIEIMEPVADTRDDFLAVVLTPGRAHTIYLPDLPSLLEFLRTCTPLLRDLNTVGAVADAREKELREQQRRYERQRAVSSRKESNP